MEKLVELAIGRILEPVTFRPPARMVSPADPRRPLDDARPAAERPPVNEDVAAPETVRMLVMAAEPSLAWPGTSRPPAKVGVPGPAAFKRFGRGSVVEERGDARGGLEGPGLEIVFDGEDAPDVCGAVVDGEEGAGGSGGDA